MVIKTYWRERRCRFFWDLSVAPTGLTQIEACCNRLMAQYPPFFTPYLSNQTFITRFEGRWYGGGGAAFEGNSTVAAVQGGLTTVIPNSGADATGSSGQADTLPDEACLIIQKRTGLTGRSNYGRWFIPGLGEAIQNAGEIDVEYRGLIKVTADSLSTDVVVSTGFSTVMHARHYNRKTNALIPITKCYAIQTLGSRRDRRRPLRLSRI
jgi:hypothetical protein